MPRSRRYQKDPFGAITALIGFIVLCVVFVPHWTILAAAAALLVGAACWACWKVAQLRRRPLPLLRSFQTSSTAAAVRTATSPAVFTSRILNTLEWRGFEQLVGWYLEVKGYIARRSRVGADGGVDILLFRKGETEPSGFVQCKAWNKYQVGVKPVRELNGVMAAARITNGLFYTSGEFTEEARAFGRDQNLTLVAGDTFLADLNALPPKDRQQLLDRATAGDYTTPTCPRCDVKLVVRKGKTDFWGCVNYPRCRQTLKFKAV